MKKIFNISAMAVLLAILSCNNTGSKTNDYDSTGNGPAEATMNCADSTSGTTQNSASIESLRSMEKMREEKTQQADTVH